jgi:hypothetical protein
MSVNLKDLVFHPNRFFEEIEYRNKNLLFPFAFVAIIAAIGIMDFLLFATHYTFDFTDVGFSSDSVIGLLVIPFITWALVTLVIFTFARAFSGDGSLPATFQNIGFGMFPLAIAAVVRLPVTILFQGSNVPMIATVFVAIVLWGFTIWSWYLWFCATLHTHEISRGKAAVTVGIVVLLQFAFQYAQYLK